MDNATKELLRAKIAEIEAGLRPYVVRLPEDDPLRKALQAVVKEREAKGLPGLQLQNLKNLAPKNAKTAK